MESLVSRRRFVAGAVGVASVMQLERAARALGMSADAAVCKLAAEQEVGPYYVANELIRRDIREGKPGVPLALKLVVMDARTCKPLTNAALDIWHCDAMGLYAGFTKQNPMGPGGPGGGPPMGPDGKPLGPPPDGFDPQHPGNHPGPPEGFGPPHENKPTDQLTFLRGIQMTDANGSVGFETVFPGFYPGRTNHIHFKVRLDGHQQARGKGLTYAGGHSSHVGQVFFSEKLNAELMALEPYRSHTIHRTENHEDMVYEDQHGADYLANVVWVKPGDPTAGLRAELIVAVDPTATPKPVGVGGGGPGFGRGPRPESK